MLRSRMTALLAALLCLSGAVVPAAAAEVDCADVYCFSPTDFDAEGDLKGICLTGLPEGNIGTMMLGTRVLRPGDILTAEQVSRMTFHPVRTETDRSAEVSYLPIYENTVAAASAMTVAVRGREDKEPVAEDFAAETYKNMPITEKLKATDPEGQPLTYTVTRQPRRGTVTIDETGSFTYTPKKNKVGVDSFTFTATDPAGKVSREATVTVNILKPTDATQYTDTLGRDCRFAAEWMKNTGIFEGERLGGSACFQPDREVTRGEFVAMLVKTLDIPVDEELPVTGYTDEVPSWLQPYLAAAIRSGLTAGLPEQEVFGADTPITGAEAAVMLRNALDLSVSAVPDSEEAALQESLIPVWAETSLAVLRDSGLELDGIRTLSRGEAARTLYRTFKLHSQSSFTE